MNSNAANRRDLAQRRNAVDSATEGRNQKDGSLTSRSTLVFSSKSLEALRADLLQASPLESACFVLARPVLTPAGGWRLIAYDVMPVADSEYALRAPERVDVPADVVARVMQRARAEKASIVITHTHPLAGTVAPSSRDREGEGALLTAFRRRVPDVPHARLILGADAMHTALFDLDGAEGPLLLASLGADISFPAAPLGEVFLDKQVHDRQARAFGMEGQRRLAAIRAGIVGLGGTGSIVAQELAHLGVRELLLVDPDVLDHTNLNRLVGARRDDLGRPKVDIARDMIHSINPAASVVTLRADICDADVVRRLLDLDLFFCCTDSQGSRAVLSQFAYQYLVPGFDLGVAVHVGPGGITHVSGRVQMLAPDLPCLQCSAVLDPEAVRRDLLDEVARAADPYVSGAAQPVPQPAIISINGTVSSLAVTMMLSAVAGVPMAARHLRLRLESGRVTAVVTPADPICPSCSEVGFYRRGDAWPGPGRIRQWPSLEARGQRQQ